MEGWGGDNDADMCGSFVRPTYTVAPPAEAVISEKEFIKMLDAEAAEKK